MSCTHLAQARAAAEPAAQTTEGCQGCLAEGYDYWVHLRLCLECGYVGCCDSSPRQHATVHYDATAHPVIRSFQPGEAWRWCYVDSEVG